MKEIENVIDLMFLLTKKLSWFISKRIYEYDEYGVKLKYIFDTQWNNSQTLYSIESEKWSIQLVHTHTLVFETILYSYKGFRVIDFNLIGQEEFEKDLIYLRLFLT